MDLCGTPDKVCNALELVPQQTQGSHHPTLVSNLDTRNGREIPEMHIARIMTQRP
jgi:hypothetical protein